MARYTQGIMADGACILRDGVPVTIDSLIGILNRHDIDTATPPADAALDDVGHNLTQQDVDDISRVLRWLEDNPTYPAVSIQRVIERNAELRGIIDALRAAQQAKVPDGQLDAGDAQYWLAELDRYNNPTLVDGQHISSSDAEKALAIMKRLGCARGRYAIAEVRLRTLLSAQPSQEGKNNA